MATFWESLRALRALREEQGLDPKVIVKLAKSFPMPVFVIDATKDRFVWVSPGTLWLTGLSAEALFSVSVKSFWEAHFSPEEVLDTFLKDGIQEAEVSLDYRALTKLFHLLGYWIKLEENVYALALQDVTELYQAKEELTQYARQLAQQIETLTKLKESLEAANRALTESKEQLRLLAAVAAHTDNAVIITDAEGKVVWVNRGFELLSGYTLEEMRGKVPGRLLQGPETDPATVARIREKLRRKEPFTEEILNYTKDGRPYWLRLYVTPLVDELNEVKNFLAIEMDITEEKRRLMEMEHRLEDIQQAQRYAAHIFKRFLPPIEGLTAYFTDVQIWNAPLQGVGGDFYFFAPHEGQVIIALGDSTGHGAAAALIGVYALTSLWRSTRQSAPSLPALYQDLLEGVILSSESGSHKEGFELALLRYEPGTGRLEYLGAKRPLWIFQNGQLREVRGLRSDISSATSSLYPEVSVVNVRKGDRLYLFSDGIVHQLNGEGKKFSSQRFRDFLQTNQYLPLKEQIDLLKKAIQQWRGDVPQTDDILLLALEV
ncbi:MAG: SpoIIE family protein phosphatase [Bacteroidia bacterium]|nr:SpoIIE family protein phosphatase [Bacteroidia bacterium]MDW8056870.1 SpoIIE family protein phosphatase [Bacteroidia bacterium]